jgi:hypothetical protein
MRIYIILLLVIFGACKNKKSTKNSHLTPEYEVEFQQIWFKPIIRTLILGT